MVTVCCNACRTCVSTNILALAVAFAVAGACAGVWRLSSPDPAGES